MKNSIEHRIEFIDDPESDIGLSLNLTNEVAGGQLGGDTHFLKHQAYSSISFPVMNFATLKFSLKGGLIHNPFGWTTRLPDPSTSLVHKGSGPLLADRFFLGGSTDVRGFAFHGIGPRREQEQLATGGNAFWAAGANAYFPLPERLYQHVGDAVQLHLFANAGNLAQCHGQPRDVLSQLARGCNAAWGVGVSIRSMICTLELNYSFPVAHSSGIANQGFSLGAGFEFL